jgi:predicted Zn-dependent peptidase
MLAYAEALMGDWREGFRDLERIQAVTAEDVRRVAAKMFVASNRSVGFIKPKGRP